MADCQFRCQAFEEAIVLAMGDGGPGRPVFFFFFFPFPVTSRVSPCDVKPVRGGGTVSSLLAPTLPSSFTVRGSPVTEAKEQNSPHTASGSPSPRAPAPAEKEWSLQAAAVEVPQ